MLEIRPVYTSYEREEYTKMFGIVPEKDCFVIAAHNGGKFVGTAYGKVTPPNAVIYLMSLVDGYDDDVDRFLLGKAALNYIDLSGGVDVEYTGDDMRLAKALGFSTKTEVPALNLTGYFGEKHGEAK